MSLHPVPLIQRTPTHLSSNDPLFKLSRASKHETPHLRSTRLEAERKAKAISDAIDAEIAGERESRKANGGLEARVLLLGQAESGKSTLQKQFQLLYAPQSLEGERSSWTLVIFLNIVCAVRQVLDALDEAEATPSRSRTFNDREMAALRLRISPILTMEASLAAPLTGGIQLSSSTPKQGFYSRMGWQWRTPNSWSRRSFTSETDDIDLRDNSKVLTPMEHILVACCQDMCTLWAHDAVRQLVRDRKLRLQEWAEYVLNNMTRIANRGYVPTDNDILYARLQTLGIAEHRFVVKWGGDRMRWTLYDVGGARGQRKIWAPYFSDANAIIFLAPLSAFDQTLDEESGVNRLYDSMQLFKEICAHKLLADVHMVLFLNKADLLQRKLEAGVQVNRYVISYGDRPNQYDDVVAYFKGHYIQAHRHARPDLKGRLLYVHVTTMVDTKATQKIISNVRDTIFRSNLKSAALA